MQDVKLRQYLIDPDGESKEELYLLALGMPGYEFGKHQPWTPIDAYRIAVPFLDSFAIGDKDDRAWTAAKMRVLAKAYGAPEETGVVSELRDHPGVVGIPPETVRRLFFEAVDAYFAWRDEGGLRKALVSTDFGNTDYARTPFLYFSRALYYILWRVHFPDDVQGGRVADAFLEGTKRWDEVPYTDNLAVTRSLADASKRNVPDLLLAHAMHVLREAYSEAAERGLLPPMAVNKRMRVQNTTRVTADNRDRLEDAINRFFALRKNRPPDARDIDVLTRGVRESLDLVKAPPESYNRYYLEPVRIALEAVLVQLKNVKTIQTLIDVTVGSLPRALGRTFFDGDEDILADINKLTAGELAIGPPADNPFAAFFLATSDRLYEQRKVTAGDRRRLEEAMSAAVSPKAVVRIVFSDDDFSEAVQGIRTDEEGMVAVIFVNKGPLVVGVTTTTLFLVQTSREKKRFLLQIMMEDPLSFRVTRQTLNVAKATMIETFKLTGETGPLISFEFMTSLKFAGYPLIHCLWYAACAASGLSTQEIKTIGLIFGERELRTWITRNYQNAVDRRAAGAQ